VPPDKYSYKPVNTVRSFGEVMAHAADGMNWYCASAKAAKDVPWSDAVEKGGATKAKVVAAQDPSLDPTSRSAINADFTSLLRQISDVTNNANFDGANILNGSLGGDISFLANADASSFITLSVKDMSLGGAIVTMASTDTIGTLTAAQTVMTEITNSIANVNSALGDLGAQAKQIEGHNVFVSKLADVLTQGISNLVDADMAKESARLQALQVQQQLAIMALQIANRAPSMLLQLFQSNR